MRYFIDFEFLEGAPLGEDPYVIPISMGIVADDDRELYLEFPYDRDRIADTNPWILKHVLPHLDGTDLIPRSEARSRIVDFVGHDPNPEFWAYFASYDWVCFSQLFGRMVDIPSHFSKFCRMPKFCMDLQQWWTQLGRPDIKPAQPKNQHQALADARWNKVFHTVLEFYASHHP